MDEKEKITEVTKVVEMPDLVSYMQLVIEQLENARKRRRHIRIPMRCDPSRCFGVRVCRYRWIKFSLPAN